jgi:hypothetical protein
MRVNLRSSSPQPEKMRGIRGRLFNCLKRAMRPFSFCQDWSCMQAGVSRSVQIAGALDHGSVLILAMVPPASRGWSSWRRAYTR